MTNLNADYLLNLLVSSFNIQEEVDMLKGTNAYKHDLKLACKRLDKELDKVINTDGNLVMSIDDRALFAQMDYKKQLIKEIATLGSDDKGILLSVIQQYKLHPVEIMEACKIKLVNTQKPMP